MSLTQAKILLEKINALQKSMDLGDGGVIPIERDLMLSYIRQLYDVYMDLDGKPATKTAAPKARVSRPAPPPPPPPAPPKVEEVAPPKVQEPAPAVVETPPPPPPPPAPKPVEMAAPARPAAPASNNSTVTLSPKIESLFAVKEATELSEKLGERSINDLTRALAINDRLLYANTLFGKNMDDMSQALERLNRLGGMNEAKPVLGEYANRFSWTDEEKADMARDFIKLVRRRYM